MEGDEGVKKLATVLALTGALVLSGAASCEKEPSKEYWQFEVPDCDADDKVGTWDVKDCGPSPVARTPGAKPKVTGPAPKPRTTRR